MASFGEELKRERELRDISLKEISEATKISIRFLEALEQNNYDILPGGIFNRGFIRAYARFIGVDGEEMVNAYAHEMSQREARSTGGAPQAGAAVATAAAPQAGGVYRPEARQRVEPRPERDRGREIPPERRTLPKPSRPDVSDGRAPMGMWVLAVVAILVVAGVVTVGLLRNREHDATPDDLAQARIVRATRKAGASSPRPAPADTPAQGIASAEGVTPPEEGAAGLPASEATQAGNAPQAADAGAGPADGAPGGAAAQSASGGQPEPAAIERTIRIQATEVTRVRLMCAGRLTLDQELWPGQARTLSCAEPVVMGADNAGAVQYSLDSQPVALLGSLGERVEEIQLAPPPPPAEGAPQTPGSGSQTPPGGAHGRR